jgi:hypothetical protein
MEDPSQEDPNDILRILLDHEVYEEDLKRRVRFPERDIEPIFNRCYPAGYQKPHKIVRRRKNPKKELYLALRWKQHLVKLMRKHRLASVKFWNRRFQDWLRERREAIQR